VATTTRTDARGSTAALLGVALVFVGLAASSCSAQAPPPPAEVAPKKRPPITSGKLLDYAPAAGLRWLVVGSPSALAADADLAKNIALVIPPERMDGFAHSTGIRLDRLTTGAIAGYDLGTLYLGEIEGPEAASVRSLFSAKLVEGGVAKEREGLHRIVGTTASGGVRALVTVEDRYVAFVSGDATLARIVEAYAENRLRSPTVLHGAGLRELPPRPSDSLAAFLAPGPFSGEWGAAASGIVASAHAVRIDARKGPQGRLRATLTLTGDWSEVDGALDALERAWAELRDSPTGRLLGFDNATGVEAKLDLQHLTLSADLSVGPLARGLRDATSADVREILELDGTSPSTNP
jgi:hypothetical protein